ncbi:actin binding Rho activating protein b [Alosa sapidissima]|uniref:actin binding Rho activating protein b n=1 Tax=Alosa sapidissima TaxID=34773 RepID=UPI001C09F81B|nr:actin binding Rho activating protein b [Alosa sapidissima]
MSESTPAEGGPRKPSTNKNIKKLRAISTVCGLARSWQKWVSQNEEKQSTEPAGWSPGDPDPPPGEMRKPLPKVAPLKPSASEAGDDDNEGGIKTALVVKTVQSSVTERSSGVGMLAERLGRDPSAGDEVDRLLNRKQSPTRRRMGGTVSQMTKTLKETRRKKSDTDDSGFSEAEERGPESEGVAEDGIMLKRPTGPVLRKTGEDADKINALSKVHSTVGNLASRWQNWASDHEVTQKLNPFSEDFDYDYSMQTRLRKGEEGYGRPKEGTKTAERAKRAEQHIHREIDDMCFVIRTMADPDPDGRTYVTFGELFDRYVRISDKVVGILMRARKHGKVAFEGEMLWQGQDDGVIITLLV